MSTLRDRTAQRLRAARLDKGYTQATLSRHLGWHRRKIVRLESGYQPLLLEDAVLLSEHLEIDIFYLAGVTRSKNPAAKPALIEALDVLLQAAREIEKRIRNHA